MKLKKIKIENFRCFESLEIDFDKDVNVIVGVNGAGKSSILDAIRIALCEVAISYQYTFNNVQDKVISLNDFYIPPDSQDPFRCRAQNCLITTEALTDSTIITWKQNFLQNMAYYQINNQNTAAIKQWKTLLWDEAKNNSSTIIPLQVYYLAQRRLAQLPAMGNLLEQKMERPSAFNDCLHAGSDYQMTCQWLFLRSHVEMSNREKNHDWQFEFPDLKAIRNVFNIIFDTNVRIFFGETMPPRLMVEIMRNNKQECLMLDQLSDGYRNMLAMILDFARRLAVANPYLDNPLESPGILLIDEIELHLHPKWQQTIIPNLRKVFPNTQIIVTTHSPQVLTTVDRKNIRILKDNTIYPVTESTKGSEAKRMLENILETESRPPDSEIGKKIKTIYDLINEDKLDNAQKEIDNLQYIDENIKMDEPAIIEAESLITCKRWEKENDL
ncbi:MAG: AAA family ATPase [Planctomycetaceae bacterium]|jgi:predicted ATP-binding protein involved in virulence|nr:AAA family ATPase [Planctomycetaceae bacterium]